MRYFLVSVNLACTKALPTASRRGHFLSLNSDHFNSSGNVVDVNDEMWYTNGTKYDADNRVTEVKYDDSDTHKVNLTYDLLNRITNKTVTNGVPYSTHYLKKTTFKKLLKYLLEGE